MIITLGDRIADEMIVGFTVAASSGVFAALASVLSKVALEDGGILIRAAVCPWISDGYCDRVSIQILVLWTGVKLIIPLGYL